MAESTNTNCMSTNKKSLGNTESANISEHPNNIEIDELSINAPIEKMSDATNKDDHVLHLDKWVTSLERTLKDIPQYMCQPGHPGRISRIPENLRDVDVKAYEPSFLSFGPYHHGRARLHKMEKAKQMVLNSVLERRPELTIKDYLNELKNLETAARSFYADIEMNSEEFMRMLILDSIYIIAIFCDLPESRHIRTINTITCSRVDTEDITSKANRRDQGMEGRDYIENMQAIKRAEESKDNTNEETMTPRWFWILFMHDIFLLENQLPFFILQKIYALVYNAPETQLIGILKDRVGTMLLSYSKLDSEMMISPTKEVHHMLHLCHMFFQPTLQQQSAGQLRDSRHIFRLGSAVQLYEAGVNFEARSSTSQHSLLDITFGSSGKLVMSSLQVDDNTVSLLMNILWQDN